MDTPQIRDSSVRCIGSGFLSSEPHFTLTPALRADPLSLAKEGVPGNGGGECQIVPIAELTG